MSDDKVPFTMEHIYHSRDGKVINMKPKMDRLKADTIREDGRLERTCQHGVGHTVGDVRWPGPHLNEPYFFSHGCDGCCHDYNIESFQEEQK